MERFQHCGYLSERTDSAEKNSADTTSILGGNKRDSDFISTKSGFKA